jgi:putative ABC transport system permease protein
VTRFALKALLGRKLRTVLSAFAIVLGVATVSGTYVLTDSIDKAFGSIFTESRTGSDAVISGKAAFDLSEGTGVTAPAFDESLLQKVRALPDVRIADGSVNGEAQLIGKDGKAIVYGGAPNLGFSIARGDSPFNPLTLVEGSWPKQDEVVIDKSTAGKEHFRIGQTVGVQAVGPVQQLRLSGIVKFGSVSTIGGATLSGFDLPTAQRLFGKSGKLDEIAVASEPNVATNQLLQQIRSILAADTEVRTGQGQAQEDSKETNSFISFLQKFLLGFGGVALFVGSFVIANSLSITIAQRTRELATLRTLGASRRQLLRSIIIEALAIGILAAVIGLFAGLALAKGLFALFDAVGFTLPNNGLTFETRTVVVSLAVGIIVTLLASLRPALRATRVPPIAAVREGATLPESRYARFRLPASALLTALGFGGLLWGLFAPDLGTAGILLFMLGGALLVFIGIALLSVRLVTPLAGALGWPATKIGGTAGTLARENAQRNPQRTASTASALMIGLALVTLVTMLAAGIISSFKGSVNEIWKNADYAITAQNNFSPIPVAAAEAVAKTPGVLAVGNVRAGEALAFGKRINTTAVNPAASQMFNLDWQQGSGAVDVPRRIARAVLRQGHLRAPHRWLTVRCCDDLRRVVRPACRRSSESVLVRVDEGRPESRERRRPRPDLEGVPEREGCDATEVHRQSDLGTQFRAQYPLRAARSVGHRQPLRDREYARADGLRAHQGDRHVARDRNDAQAGAANDPARKRDHCANRRRNRDCARHRPGSPADRARRLHRPLGPGRPTHHLRYRGDLRRHHRGDLPGAPRRQAQRPRGTSVRVAPSAAGIASIAALMSSSVMSR